MKGKLLITLILGMVLISLASASLDSLGTFKQNDCVNVSQTCATCTYVNISSIGNNEYSTLVSNVPMTSIGNGEWRYTFCNTSIIGRYDVRGQGDINGVDTTFSTYFDITPSGFLNNIGFYLLILVFSLGIIVLGFSIKDGWVVTLGSLGLYFLSFYILFYGLNGLKDTVYTWGIGIIMLGIAMYLSIRSTVEMIN